MKIYLVITTHKLVAVYDNMIDAENAKEKIKASGIEDPNKVFAYEYDTKDSDVRVAKYIERG